MSVANTFEIEANTILTCDIFSRVYFSSFASNLFGDLSVWMSKRILWNILLVESKLTFKIGIFPLRLFSDR